MQWLKALVALAEDLGSAPSTHMTAYNICNSGPRGSDASSGLQEHQVYTIHLHANNTYTRMNRYKIYLIYMKYTYMCIYMKFKDKKRHVFCIT